MEAPARDTPASLPLRGGPSGTSRPAEKADAAARTRWLAIALAILLVYLGLADGFLKLSTGSRYVTLIRDLILLGIVFAAIAAIAMRRESVRPPPLTAWVLAIVALVAVQLLNPSNKSLSHALASVRPHLEWVPLFFLAYATMQTKERLRVFLVLLCFVGAANGAVGYVQFNLTPEQLSNWGPGYRERISGTGDVSERVFFDESGTKRTRPFALGSDFGFGGLVGMLAVPAVLALLTISAPGWRRLLILPLAAGVTVAVLTSQARVAVIGSFIALAAFFALAATARRALSALAGIVGAAIVTYVVVALVAGGSSLGSFDRYSDITPTRIFSTTYDERHGTLEKIPLYASDFPLGAGLGSVGPANPFDRESTRSSLNAESEFTYLLVELGVPGLLVFLAFHLRLLFLSARIRHVPGTDERLLLAALAAPLFALLAAWVSTVTTATTPAAPYFWFAAGTLAYWLTGTPGASTPRTTPRAQSSRRRAAQASTG